MKKKQSKRKKPTPRHTVADGEIALCDECKAKRKIILDVFSNLKEETKMIARCFLFVRYNTELVIRYSIFCERCGLNHFKGSETHTLPDEIKRW